MSSSEIHIVAIITPAQGKESRVKELLIDLTKKVQAEEPDVSKYQLFEQYDSKTGTNVFVVEETYKSQQVYEAHFKTPYFQALGKAIGDEGLLAAELDIKHIKPVGGFGSR